MALRTGVRVVWNDTEYDRLIRSPSGPTARKLGRYAEVVAQGMKRRAPVSPDGSNGRPSGYMRSSVGWIVTVDIHGLVAVVSCNATTPDGFPYPMVVEFGSEAHMIRTTGPWPLRDKYGHVFGPVVKHPGTDPQPFMRPALDDIRGREV
jgi:hypothetical protein